MQTGVKLIVLAAFDRNEETGELAPSFEPREMPSAERARQEARIIAARHAGVIAWSRDADLDLGEYGPPEILASYGDVPEME